MVEIRVKPIVGILTSREELLPRVLADLEEKLGPHDVASPWRPFDHTPYYEPEMGPGLKRAFVSFANLIDPWTAGGLKAWTAVIEDRYRHEGRRTVNLDAGYIDSNKVVLVTGKHGAHKIALAEKVWADMLLWYNKGWVALPWAFPDFRDGGYFPVFTRMRTEFKKQLSVLRDHL